MALIQKVHGNETTVRTVCLMAGRRRKKGRGRQAGQAEKQIEDRLLQESTAWAPCCEDGRILVTDKERVNPFP
jgi:hypothetical protein